MSDAKPDEAAPKKKGGKMKWILIGLGVLVLGGGGAGAGLYFGGVIGGKADGHAEASGPKLVPHSEQKRAEAGKEGGGEGEGSEGGSESAGKPTPKGEGGDEYASNYYALEKEFTSNLRESVHFIQVGVAVSTPYDDTVINNLKTHEIAVRSAILLALSETEEEEVFTADGKAKLQRRLTKAVNDTLKQKEGFGGISNVYFTNFIVQ
ncbi:flagellar basal body-associated FliL family protein [Sphingomonas sp. BGYR3]|uniref:flagellar basal body-associated FliL family protein n=1 Tax=Sphingomonas sp. BGYR3 TaxID=2975483 RepID=UPI0021A87B89|nr:flagellar basal body-associated FliL family protein [Sphingomonas sp. BGYR3]MDG5488302.1 flagellar basal body-associated FliL family protein [Sphingomonas sp. BGYR3]